jgi:hypothetical protein
LGSRSLSDWRYWEAEKKRRSTEMDEKKDGGVEVPGAGKGESPAMLDCYARCS